MCAVVLIRRRRPLLTSMSAGGHMLKTPRTTLSMIFSNREGETYFLPSSAEFKLRHYLDADKMILTTDILISRPLDEGKHAGERIHRFIVALQSVKGRVSSLVSPRTQWICLDCLRQLNSEVSDFKVSQAVPHLHPSAHPPTSLPLLVHCFA